LDRYIEIIVHEWKKTLRTTGINWTSIG